MNERNDRNIEIDVLIAGLCGIKVHIRQEGLPGSLYPVAMSERGVFAPSSHSCDAFIAADKVGRPTESSPRGMSLVLRCYHDGCVAYFDCNKWDRQSEESEGDTPAMAICNAILKLAEAGK